MKKSINLLLLTFWVIFQATTLAVAQDEMPDKENSFRKAAAYITELDRKAEMKKKAIRSTKTKVNIDGQSYYVAANGDDTNDGLSPDRPIKSLDKVNSLNLQVGDGVLFKRGDLWRGHIKTKQGVTYSAYGKGDKPRLYGSPYDAVKDGKWEETETPNVYVYDKELPDDIGTLVFNEGEACAFKVMKRRLENGSTVHIETGQPFNDYRDLKVDLEFYHDYKEKKRVYLYSSEGSPAQRFQSIELLVRTNIIYAGNNVTVDNLCLKYCGAHGIGSGTTKGLTVTNCELGWIGGSIQGENLYGRSNPTRFGNAIEIYGGCDYYLVDNCYIYEVYDAAITHQFSNGGTESIIMKDITYSNNLVEDCVYSIEYFLGKADNDAIRYMDNVRIFDNLMRRSGFGWGKQRPDKETPAHIKSWNHHWNKSSNFIISNNIIDRGTMELLNITAGKEEWIPSMQSNTYIQFINIPAGSLGSKHKRYPFDGSINKVLKDIFGEKNPKIFYTEPLNK